MNYKTTNAIIIMLDSPFRRLPLRSRVLFIINRLKVIHGFFQLQYNKKKTSEQVTLLTSLLDSEDSASNIKPAEVNSNLVATEFIIKLQNLKTERIKLVCP